MRTFDRINRRRAAFSLVEMLVVIAIIAILLALLAGAVMRMMGVAPEKATETSLSKIASALSTKWTAVSRKARQEDNLPSAFLTMTGGSPDQARSVYVAAVQQREFPTSFSAATTPPNGLTTANAFYVDYLKTAPGSLSTTMQSSICLYMVLKAGQAGTTFNVDNLGPNEVGVEPTSGLKYIKDGWGQPLQFTLSGGPVVTSSGPDKTFGTPDDLTSSRFNGSTTPTGN